MNELWAMYDNIQQVYEGIKHRTRQYELDLETGSKPDWALTRELEMIQTDQERLSKIIQEATKILNEANERC